MDRHRSFWNLLLASSAVAAVVSLLTTAMGLSQYLSVLLAWPLAAAVQGGLFGLAWLLAAGARRERPLLLALYLMTMPFSVVFSYVMLQSELTARTRPVEAQRELLDTLRDRQADVAEMLERGRAEATQLGIRLDAWLDAERRNGWATSTCDGVDQCYLSAVCDRLDDRIAAWERDRGRSYRQGPGQALIYTLIDTERRAVERLEGPAVLQTEDSHGQERRSERRADPEGRDDRRSPIEAIDAATAARCGSDRSQVPARPRR
ncbi:MAG: hypothetical protein AAGE94_14120 [Acidobacteriota bacterium]